MDWSVFAAGAFLAWGLNYLAEGKKISAILFLVMGITLLIW